MRVRTPRWAQRYTLGLMVFETLTAAVAAAGVLLEDGDTVGRRTPLLWAAVLLPAVWPVLLQLTGAHKERVFGSGSDEYRRVARAGLLLLGAAGFISYAATLDLSRAFVVVVLPLVMMATLVGRYAARCGLNRARRAGRCAKRVLIAGRGGAVLELADRLRARPYTGLQVVALSVTPDDRDRVAGVAGVPVSGLDDVVGLAERVGADTIAVTSASETAAQYLRTLSWQLEGTGVELLVAPGLVEVAGPRLHIRPFEGLPLLSVEQPRFEGWPRVFKGAVDRIIALLALILLAPVMTVIALAVRLSDPGPVFFRQQRVGVNGRPFTMIKFRSMVVGADARVHELLDANMSDGPLFKMRSDPRVTGVGRILRRTSLDELPQLLNVLAGSMSLVGPRPPLPSEVAQYDSSVSRRLLVKPGLTGLWQISGRSDLSWEESVRLDLRYVENWSMATDLLILWKTGRALVSRSGAY